MFEAAVTVDSVSLISETSTTRTIERKLFKEHSLEHSYFFSAYWHFIDFRKNGKLKL